MAETVYSLVSMLVDVAVDVPRLPQRGGDVFATGTRTVPGAGFNLAVAVARQGVRCVYGAPHGTGPYGDLIRRGLAAEGVEVAGTPRGNGDSGFCVVCAFSPLTISRSAPLHTGSSHSQTLRTCRSSLPVLSA